MPQLSQDPYFADTTVLVVSASAPQRAGDLLDLGALVLRYAGFGYVPTGDGLHCVPDPGARLDTTIERSSLRPEQVRGRPPAAVALAYLDAHLDRPPYLVATHGPLLGRLIAAHRDSCPVLGDLTILDIARLAHHLHPETGPRLERWAGHLDVSGLSTRPGERTRLAAALFMHLMRELLRREEPGDFAALIRIGELQRSDGSPPQRSPSGPATPSTLHDRRLPWTPVRV